MDEEKLINNIKINYTTTIQIPDCRDQTKYALFLWNSVIHQTSVFSPI